MMLRLIALLWAVFALISAHHGEPRLEFWGCLMMCGLAGIAAEVRASRR